MPRCFKLSRVTSSRPTFHPKIFFCDSLIWGFGNRCARNTWNTSSLVTTYDSPPAPGLSMVSGGTSSISVNSTCTYQNSDTIGIPRLVSLILLYNMATKHGPWRTTSRSHTCSSRRSKSNHPERVPMLR
jgi:hypothetical protein